MSGSHDPRYDTPEFNDRTVARYNTLNRARAYSQKHPKGIFAVVRDISDGGCKLLGSRIASIEDVFILRADEAGERVELACQVIWRKPRMIGARFLNE